MSPDGAVTHSPKPARPFMINDTRMNLGLFIVTLALILVVTPTAIAQSDAAADADTPQDLDSWLMELRTEARAPLSSRKV